MSDEMVIVGCNGKSHLVQKYCLAQPEWLASM